MPLFLGLDSSTQSLTAVVIEIDDASRRIVLETTLSFDEALPRYGTRHGTLPDPDPAVGVAPPLMWTEALDVMMARVASSGIEVQRIAAMTGSAQQHGSVYLNARSDAVLAALDPAQPLAGQLQTVFSRPTSPIWTDSTTSEECREITAAVGGERLLAAHTGSRAFERFTGPQIRRVFKRSLDAYSQTARIHLVSSFLASLLIGRHAEIDPGDASGANLMDLRERTWWRPAVDVTAPALDAKLPPIVEPWTRIGTLAPYWQQRHGFPAAAVIAWTGDNPSSLIGAGLSDEGRIAISLGTSDTIFAPMTEPRVDETGTGHVFGAPTGAFMGLTCFQNGSLARERVREAHGLTWSAFSDVLESLPPGNGGRLMLPWFAPEITPAVASPDVHRYGPAPTPTSDIRAVIEAQQLSMALHSRWMASSVRAIHATGGAAVNRPILQVMADVFGADVFQLPARNSAALGAALRAAHAHVRQRDGRAAWPDVMKDLAEPLAASRIAPDPRRHALYREMLPVYAACEAHARGLAPDPAALVQRFARHAVL
jgi:xylulokinase